MKRLSVGAAALLVLSASAAQAQEATWSGPYVGAHAGWGWKADETSDTILFDTNLDGTFNNTVNTATGANAFSPGFCNGAAQTATPAGGCKDDENGVDFGVRAGYDWRSGSVVLGALAEVSRMNVVDAASAYSTTPAFYTMERKLRGVGALRVRGGVVVADNLFYATGGVAKGRVRHRFSTSNTVNTFQVREDKWASGYQYGGGVERQIGANLTMGLEYLYTRLEDDDFRVRAAGPAPATNPFILVNAGGTDFRRSEDDLNTHSVRLTAAYRF